MVVLGRVLRDWAGLAVILVLTACVAKEDLIIPNKQQRIAAVNNYKQCVSQAIDKRLNRNADPEALVRDSIAHCRSSKYAMLKDYPKGWRASYEKQVDEEILKSEVAYVIESQKR